VSHLRRHQVEARQNLEARRRIDISHS
jgi:hypothetical protein